MPKRKFKDINFRQATLTIINQANVIIEEYAKQGFDLTLRQLYYQFVARDMLANKQSNYDRLGSIISDARLAGLVDWERIEDRMRVVSIPTRWDDPADIVSACARSFRLDRWKNQNIRVEVWVEKDAVSGIFEGVCRELDLPLLACRGYTSQSAMWRAAQRILSYGQESQAVRILHFGDHDCSGIDMSRDIEERLNMLTEKKIFVRRVALTMEQVEQYQPPPNPAKDTDSRFASYRDTYGEECWELDALDPNVLVELVRTNVDEFRNKKRWNEVMAEEKEAIDLLKRTSTNWSNVVDYLNKED
jgi:hypothetical protein